MEEQQLQGDHESFLLVDDDEIFRSRLAQALVDRGYEARQAAGYEMAVQLAQEDSPERAVVDLRMPGKGGLDVVEALHGIDATTKIVVLTGYGSIATAVDAMRLGAVHYLAKPADVDDLLLAFKRAEEPPLRPGKVEDYEVPSLARAEWEHIQRVLSDSGGNISEAARRLGIHRRSLQRKLRKFAPK
ncbi:MAG: two-component system response regulator [Planctomycetota bacterium]|nr:MAG: two-component system response regulator [Planctomycetota bacterium]